MNKMEKVVQRRGLLSNLKGVVKSVVFSGLVFLGLQNADAQVTFSLGPKGGATFSHLSKDKSNQDSRKGFVAGGFANIGLARIVAIQPEVLYNQFGTRGEFGGTNTRLNSSYIQVPVLLKLRLPLGAVYPNIFAGPSWGFRNKASYTVNNTETGESIGYGTTAIKKHDFGGVVGAGIDINAGPVFFTVDGRYGFGFDEINNDIYGLNAKNRQWAVSAGIGFLLGKNKSY